MKKEIKIGSKVKDLVFPSSEISTVTDISTSTHGVYVTLDNIKNRWLDSVALINVQIKNKLK